MLSIKSCGAKGNGIADEETMKQIPAIVAKNLTAEKFIVDGEEHILCEKQDVLTIHKFENLCACKI